MPVVRYRVINWLIQDKYGPLQTAQGMICDLSSGGEGRSTLLRYYEHGATNNLATVSWNSDFHLNVGGKEFTLVWPCLFLNPGPTPTRFPQQSKSTPGSEL